MPKSLSLEEIPNLDAGSVMPPIPIVVLTKNRAVEFEDFFSFPCSKWLAAFDGSERLFVKLLIKISAKSLTTTP